MRPTAVEAKARVVLPQALVALVSGSVQLAVAGGNPLVVFGIW